MAKTKSSQGYILVKCPDHPRADSKGYVFEHILVWETHHGKPVPDGYVVHHKDKDKTNNAPTNLVAMSNGEHTAMHHIGRKRSDETKKKISIWAKERLKDKRNHPRYKNIDILSLASEVSRGATIKSVCEKYNINKTTYYKKLKEISNG